MQPNTAFLSSLILSRLILLLIPSSLQMVFSFCDKLFGLVIKDIEAMDASILKGEPASGKKQKVPRVTIDLLL